MLYTHFFVTFQTNSINYFRHEGFYLTLASLPCEIILLQFDSPPYTQRNHSNIKLTLIKVNSIAQSQDIPAYSILGMVVLQIFSGYC